MWNQRTESERETSECGDEKKKEVLFKKSCQSDEYQSFRISLLIVIIFLYTEAQLGESLTTRFKIVVESMMRRFCYIVKCTWLTYHSAWVQRSYRIYRVYSLTRTLIDCPLDCSVHTARQFYLHLHTSNNRARTHFIYNCTFFLVYMLCM